LVPGLRRRAHVDLDVIVANARALASVVSADPLVDVRANAYGHGLLAVVEALRTAGFEWFLASAAERPGLENALPGLHLSDAEPVAADSVLGLALYGLDAALPDRAPALSLTAEIVAVKRVPGGRGVSYGYTYRTSAPATLVLAALGYADGVPRAASNRAPVDVAGRRARVTGRVAMDQFVVDIGDGDATVGERVVLFGSAAGMPTVHDWADATGVRPEVITAGLGNRIRREYGVVS
jgi:alanine racemase